jgi:hypothetical protein
MKYKQFYFLIFLLQVSITIGQSIKIPQKGNHFLFTFKDKTYLIENDSIYNINYSKKEYPRLHGLVMKEYKFISNGSLGYMKNASSGIVYGFDGISFKRLDHSFDFKSQFRSYTFFYKNIIIDFGGYGLHNFKNILTYYNFAKKETELYSQNNALKSSPTPRDRMLAQYENSMLYIGPGHGIPLDVENPYENAGMINDYWKFSLVKKKWEKLGQGTIKATYPYDVVYDYNNHTLLISENGISEIDIKNNLLINYPDANIDIVKSLNKNNTLASITYNKAQGGFYLIIDTSLSTAEVLFVKRDDFLGKRKIYGDLYASESNLILYIFVVSALLLLIVVYFKTKKNLYQLITSKIVEIEEELKDEDFKVLTKLVASYPDYVNYSDLLELFPEYLSYESKKKKIRQSILTIEEYLIQKIKVNKPIFIFRKNIEDKREKQIRIK